MRRKMKRLTSFVAALVMTAAYLVNVFPANRVQAITEGSNILSEASLNVACKYLYLGEEGRNTFDFNVEKNVSFEGAVYHWYIRKNKGNPEAVSINSKTGVVTAKGAGTAYIRCKITLSDGTVLRPEAKVVVINNITEVAINNIPQNQTIEAGEITDFNRSVLNTTAGKAASANGITRWEIADDTAGVGSASDKGIIIPSKAGEFSIRAVCFENLLDYRQWLANKEVYSDRITAASNWVKITVISHEGTAATLDELADLLASEDITTITIATQEKLDIILYEGDYTDKTLIVDAPNVNIENHAYFKSIIMKPANYALWLECVSGNKLTIMEKNVLMYATDTAEIENIQVDTEEAQKTSEDSSKSADNKKENTIKSFTFIPTVGGQHSTNVLIQPSAPLVSTASTSTDSISAVDFLSNSGRAIVLAGTSHTEVSQLVQNNPAVGPAPISTGISSGSGGNSVSGLTVTTGPATIPGGSGGGTSSGSGGNSGSGGVVTTEPVTIPGSGGLQGSGSGGPTLVSGGSGSGSMITNGTGGGLLIMSGGPAILSGGSGASITNTGSGGTITGGSGGGLIGGTGGGLIGGTGGVITGGLGGGLIGGTGGATISGSGGGFSGYIQGSSIGSSGNGVFSAGTASGNSGTLALYSDRPETPVVINSKSTVTLSGTGAGSFAVNMTNGAAGSTLSSSVPVKVMATVVATYNLGPGSEGSIIAFSSAAAGSQVYNNTGNDIILAFTGSNGASGSGVVVVHSGQTAAVTATGAAVAGIVRTAPVISTPITASEIYEGQSLSASALSGSFKSSATNQAVAGTLTWDNPTSVVNATGNYAWTFTPTDTTGYNVVKGTVNLKVISKVTPTAGIITATAVLEGASLSASALSASFKNSANNLIVEGALVWDNPALKVNSTGEYAWTFTPSDTVHYNVAKGTVTVQVNIVKVSPVTGSAIAATAITAGEALSVSTLSGSFKNGSTGQAVGGKLEWDNKDEVVSETHAYAWTFTPSDTVHYNVVKGTITVQVTIIPPVTPVTGSAITATTITTGESLSTSTLSGSFIDPDTSESVEGILSWDNKNEIVSEIHAYAWTFTPSNSVHYNIVKGTVTVEVTMITPVIQVTPVTGSAITAMPINAGQPLSTSTLSGSFIDNTTGNTVEGSLTWYNNDIIAVVSDYFTWIFTPKDTTKYNEVIGTVYVPVDYPMYSEGWLTVLSNAIMMIKGADYNLDVMDASTDNTEEKRSAVEGFINELPLNAEVVSIQWNAYTLKYDVKVRFGENMALTSITVHFY